MTECWSEGELRAYRDRELPPKETELLAAHLGECARCAQALAELEKRAAWVAELMDDLPAVAAASPARHRARWIAVAAAALAAGLAIAALLAPRRVAPRVSNTVPPLAVRQVETAAQPPEAAAAPAPVFHEARLRKPAPRKTARRPAAADDAFVSINDEPFETGVVVRVALGPSQVPADVVFGSDGRARAIRMVSYK